MEHYYAHGKLLLSGEYVVLKGAQALAIPTLYGQRLQFMPGGENLHWSSYDHQKKVWFTAVIDEEVNLLHSSDAEKAAFLLKILKAAYQFRQHPLPCGQVETHLEFPNEWGLGSSSTLTSLVGQWLNVDPMRLFFATQNGSGYDVACAGSALPLTYQLERGQAHWQTATLPAVLSETAFIHLNKKQNSRPEVERFMQRPAEHHDIVKISELSHQFLQVKTIKELQNLMDTHEARMSRLLQIPPVKSSQFSDFQGSIKSLGAWGGDFIWACGSDISSYFPDKGYRTVLKFSEMVLKK